MTQRLSTLRKRFQTGMLRDHRQLESRPLQLFPFEQTEIGVREPNLASARSQCPRDATQQRRLPTAVAAKNDNQLAGLDG
jgi:hypothetical protein